MTMTTALAEESREVALDLHRLFGDVDRARWCADARSAMAARLDSVHARLERALGPRERPDPLEHALSPKLAELRHTLSSAPSVEDGRRAWVAFRARVMPAYEAMAASLRASSVHVPSLRPTNYARNLFHVLSAASGLVVLELIPSPRIVFLMALALAVWAWTMEISRRRSTRLNALLLRFFKAIIHPHESHRVNSGTWFITALVALAATGYVIPSAVALVVLGLGDPLAALVGRRLGRIRWFNGRTIEGTLAFVVAGTLGGVALLTLGHSLGFGLALAVAAGAAITGAIAELFTRRIDDNLAIPLAAWVGAAAVLAIV